MKWATAIARAVMPVAVLAVTSTDSLQDADPAQSGYLPNHNMDPTKLPGYTLSWKNTYNTAEAFYAKPLVWTPPGATSEVVIVVSNQNIIRLVDGATGTLLKSRTLDPPFQSVDTNCGDIPNTVGITGTPIIDAATNIMYLFSKGYKGAATGSGTINGQYKFYGIDLTTLTDAIPPVIIDGHYADNDPTRYFVGGTVAQRPALTEIGDTIIAGFGGHCDNFNYTGMLVAVSKTPGVGVTSIMAMEASPGAPSPQTLDITVQGGGKAGIWHSGMGIATDTNRVFFVTGNGRGGGDNAGGKPVTGKIKISTLQQTTVNMGVNAGVFTQQDYFEPYEYQSLNGGDRDFGSSGAALLDPIFSGGGVNRLVVAGGKSGKIYIMDADNLGGFAMGTGGSDAVIQEIIQPNSLLSGVASYPAEGGYIYFCPSGDALYAYKFGTDATGKPLFTLAGKSALTFAGRGVPSVTSLNGLAGTGIVWMTDINQGVVAYNAVPVGGVLQPISLPASGRLQKMQRPGFGNGRVYTFSTNHLIAIGPVAGALPLVCTPSPATFGSIVIGQTSTIQITCKASAALTLKGCTTGLATFQCSGIPAKVASGASFSFPVTFNLSSANVEAARLGGYQVLPGAEGAAVNVINSAGATVTSVQMTATVVASGGFLVAGAVQVDFGGITLGSSSARTVTLTNDGAGALTFTGFAYQDLTITSPPFVNVTSGSPTPIGNGFTASNFPTIGSTIAPGATITLSMTFSPSTTGSLSSLLTFWSNGGFVDIMLVGTSSGSTSTSSSTVASSTTTSSPTMISSSLLSSSSIISSYPISSSPAGSAMPSSFLSPVSPTSSIPLSGAPSSQTSFSSSSSILSSTFSFLSSAAPSSQFSSSSSSTNTYISNSSPVGPSTNTASTTSSGFITSTTSSSVSLSTPTGFYPYIGCFIDTSTSHALPLLFANNSMTPELCQAYVASLAAKPTPTILPYWYVEYRRECYGGSSFAWGPALL